MLAINNSLENWGPCPHRRHFSVYIDNLACKGILHHPEVSPKMALMLTFFSNFYFLLHHVKERSNVVADAFSRPAVCGEHSNEPAAPINHVIEISGVEHERTDECYRYINLLDRPKVHSALIQYITLDVSLLLLDDAKLREQNCRTGVAREQIHNTDFQVHVLRAHLSKEVRKAIQQGYHKYNFQSILKSKQANKNFIIGKRLMYLKQVDAMKKLCIPDTPDLKTKIL